MNPRVWVVTGFYVVLTACLGSNLPAGRITIPPTIPNVFPTIRVETSPTLLPGPTITPIVHPIPTPVKGSLYHGVYPGGISGGEDDITLKDLQSYEMLAGKPAAWVYFSHNWYKSRSFPGETAQWIHSHGALPYIRLMLRSSPEQNQPEPLFTPSAILKGDFDSDFQSWCVDAAAFKHSILVEYGTEMNGEWFPWNGIWNGADDTAGYGTADQPDGPERFRDAYRHIIGICRQEEAKNITWVFHVNAGDVPNEPWNRFENYYPGSGFIDWLAVSVYGAQTPADREWPSFRSSMDAIYPRIAALDPAKPIIVAEFGSTWNNPLGDQAAWTEEALTDMESGRWPRLIGFSWWNEAWQNDDNPANDTTMRLQDNPALTRIFKNLIGENPQILGKIPTQP